jgi:hypothetical protein
VFSIWRQGESRCHLEGDELVSEEDAADPDAEWPYDPIWVDLGASPLDQLRRAADPSRYPPTPTTNPTTAP